MRTGAIALIVFIMCNSIVLAQPATQQEVGPDWLDYVTSSIGLLSILIFFLLMYLLYRLWGRSSKSRSSQYKYNYINPGSKMANFGNSNNSDYDLLKNRIEFLEGEISQLKEEVRKLAVKVDSSKIPMEVFVAGEIDTPMKKQELNQRSDKPAEQPAASGAFFLSTPNSDGSFNNSSANPSYKEGASIYKFMHIKENRAKFWIDERDASVKLALAYPDKNIDPVCDALNAYDPRARKISTREPGVAELIGDKWKVITKAKIRYDN